jgi:hypothetical protein
MPGDKDEHQLSFYLLINIEPQISPFLNRAISINAKRNVIPELSCSMAKD